MLPLYIFGIVYLVGLLLLGLFFLLNIYYLKRYKVFDFVGQLNTILTAGVIALILIITIILLAKVDWMETISLWNNL